MKARDVFVSTHLSIMAPSAIETVTVTETPVVLKLHTTKAGTGDYKELLPVTYDQEAEEGKKGFSAAKVSMAVLSSQETL